jgi:hypothetical protein
VGTPKVRSTQGKEHSIATVLLLLLKEMKLKGETTLRSKNTCLPILVAGHIDGLDVDRVVVRDELVPDRVVEVEHRVRA